MEELYQSRIAVLHLRAAIKMIQLQNYASALALAAAANDVLTHICRKNGVDFPNSFLPETLAVLEKTTGRGFVKVFQAPDQTTSRRRPIDDELIKAHFFFESAYFINNAMAIYEILFNREPDGEEFEFYYKEILH